MNKKEENSFFINKRKIGLNCPTYFIAEIGSNFDGDINRAKELIHLAKETGADAAKFQHYTADSLVSDFGFKSLENINSHQSNWGSSVYETYNKASLNKEWTAELKKTCDQIGIEFMTSPYSLDLINYVNKYVNSFKIGSGDITWLESINLMASKKKPILLATGASNEDEVHTAVKEIKKHTKDIVLMQCNTNYTVSKDNLNFLNLNVLKRFKYLFPDVILGLSDHTKGFVSVLGAVTLGARVIEKHFTDDNKRPGPDHSFALDIKNWKEMILKTRELEAALGIDYKKIELNEKETVILQRRSIRAKEFIKVGDIVSREKLEFLRPCPQTALNPSNFQDIIGKKFINNVKKGDIIRFEDLQM
tara:strand:- start:866 stop:1951 length:1086 start_codon:yes stop_codon:yes gene_type:complete